MDRPIHSEPPSGAAKALAPLMLILAVLAAIALVVAYWTTSSNQVIGGLLALSLLAAGAGLVLWSRGYMRNETVVGEREPLASDEEWQQLTEPIQERGIGRRGFLVGSLTLLGGALFVALASTLRSVIGPAPGKVLWETPWAPGLRLVREDGSPIEAHRVPLDSVMTLFPEGHIGELRGAVLLFRVRPELLELTPEQQQGTVDGMIAYSKVCTHAGCPVSLFEDSVHLLACPCHQSTFDILRGGVRTGGPAVYALPQLPLKVDGEGHLTAAAGFTRPIGPGFWSSTT